MTTAPEYTKTKFTKAGEPRMGTTITLFDAEGGFEVKVVGKLWGRGSGLIGVILEDDTKARLSLEWPLAKTTAGYVS